jgi:membrane protease YdiL (CAAX protease family)
MTPAHEQTIRSYPFWSYVDFAAFILLAFPSILGGIVLTKEFTHFFHLPFSDVQLMLPAQFLGYGLLFLCLYLLLKTRYDQPFWESLRFTFPARGFWWSFWSGPVLALAVAGLGLLLRAPVIDLPFEEMLSSRFSIALLGLFITTLGPVCEELAFRGFLLPLLKRSIGTVLGILFTALPFALLHGQQYHWSWQHLSMVLMAGSVFGFVRYRTGSTASAAAIHSTYNLTYFAVFLLQKFILVERY